MDEELSTPPSPPAPIASPFSEEEEEQATHDYSRQLDQVLGEDDEDEDDEEGFGEFVYSGVDVERPEEDKEEGYGEQLAEVLGTTHEPAEEQPSAPAVPLEAPSLPNGTFSRVPPVPASPSQSARSTPSNDTFPGLPPTPNSYQHQLSGSPRRPSYHPQISRLRSISTQQQQRFVSNSSYSTALEHPADSPGTSGFDLASRRSSTSNLFDLPPGSSDLLTPTPSSPAATEAGKPPSDTFKWDTFKWSVLRRLSSRIYPPISKGGVGLTSASATQAGLLGVPTVMAVSGVVAVGTSKGWVMVFDFGQNLRCVCGTEAIAKEAGPVTAVAISQDHTFVAVGHALGAIHLYALLQPTKPARSVPPTTLQLVLTGRKEGHIAGSRILHLGFIGARHTAIVSSDDTGLAFYHSLGKVLMLASTDIIRMLGRYPDPHSASHSPNAPTSPTLDGPALNGEARAAKSKKPSTILDMAPLPLGPAHHSSDSHSLVALLTPTKLVVVGLKPTPRTWWRATPAKDGIETPGGTGAEYSRNGVLSWWPSVVREGIVPTPKEKEKGAVQVGEDPVLAFAWGRRVRLVRLSKGVKSADKGVDVEFAEGEGWVCDHQVLGLRWYNSRVIFVLTAHHVDVFDIVTRERIGRDSNDLHSIVSHDYYSSAFDASRPSNDSLSYSASFVTHKKKLFLLTLTDVRVGAILSWADRILALMQPGTILDAIEVTTSYLLGQVDASTIALPEDPVERRDIVEPKLREILGASLEFVFSEDRLRDGSHSDAATMQALFEGLVGTCVRACLATGDVDWLFDDLYERYEQNGIEAIFLERIEPFVLSGSVHALPPSVSQRLIAIHEDRGQFEAAQRIIWHVDPEFIDINQALKLCQREKLYDALIYVYTRSMHDFVAPLVELLALVRKIQRDRRRRPRRIGDEEGSEGDEGASLSAQDVEKMVPDAYKVFAYLSQALTGLSYPSKEPLPYEEGVKARNAIYAFLFSGSTLSWPERGGQSILTSDEDGSNEPPYPYLRLLLRFDAEATLDTLDLAFEESYLDDDIPGKTLDRQRIVDLLVEVMGSSSPADAFSPIDRTFLHIFVARNLPKYPQYISLRPEVLHQILVGLAEDLDQSTTDDRQLAAEYLLSSYTPSDSDTIIALFERAGFFRILRSIYRGERRWAALASTYLRDPHVGADVFAFLRETLKLATKAGEQQKEELAQTILEAVPALVQADEAGLQQTAELVDTYLPSHHAEVIEQLSSSAWRQFAYLRCLLEPAFSDDLASTSAPYKDRAPSTRLGTPQRLQYLSLLCSHEPEHVIRYLGADSAGLADDQEALRICEEAGVYDALVWAMDRKGETKAALDRVDATLESRTDLLLVKLLHREQEELIEEAEEDEDEEGRGERGFARREATAPADAVLDQIAAISRVAIQICVKRSSGPERTKELSGEDLWFRLLSSLVSTVRAVRAIAPAPPRPSDRSSHRRTSGASIIFHDDPDDPDEPQPLSLRASDTLSSLIPTALSSLVSTTSSRDVSFPNLVRRLIESNARSPAADRSYAEFKVIVTSMLDTYVFEGDLLSLTSKISAQDLFEHVEVLKVEREKGWRAGGECCEDCAQPVWGPQGQGSPPMTRSASVDMVVKTMGMTGRPRMKKRPSLKGKEVDWPELESAFAPQPVLAPPRGIVIGRDGRLWHEGCRLLSLSAGGQPYRMGSR